MKESITFVGIATIKQLQKDVSLNTKGQYMKGSNTLVGNAIIKQPQILILHNIKGQYMNESNTLADFANNNFLKRDILLDTKEKYMKD